ncbi:hypothetical protein MNV49_005177 [Pseudohyphozyma bogoriensis]|nr:hypothetical protein MNV49_005177 [Pseudohyphozyma bogoriensis]
MATFQSCPSEILIKILEHSIEWFDWDWGFDDESRRLHLCSTALVARNWTRPSQMLLWREMSVEQDETVVERLIGGTTPGLYRTKKLRVDCVQSTEILALLGHLQAVDEFILYNAAMRPSYFESPELRRLVLDEVNEWSPDQEANIKIGIERLELRHRVEAGPTLTSLIESSQDSLTHLFLRHVELTEDLLDALKPAGPNLDSLSLIGSGPLYPVDLADFYNECNSLECLTLSCDRSVLEALLLSDYRILKLVLSNASEIWLQQINDLLIELLTETDMLEGGTLED